MPKVGSIMTRALVTVLPDCPLERARGMLRERGIHHLLVTERDRLVGVLSERDLLQNPGEREARVGDRMIVSLETVSVDESASKACRRLLERRVGCLPVVHDGHLAGILSESDLLRLFVAVCRFREHDPAVDPPVETVMSREVEVVAPERGVAEAFELCRAKGIRHLPVVRDGWLVGIVSDHDLLPVVGAGGELREVESLMTKDYVAVERGTALSQVAECMLQNGFHSLPVLVKGALKGIVTSSDVLRALDAIDEETLESAWTDKLDLGPARAQRQDPGQGAVP